MTNLLKAESQKTRDSAQWVAENGGVSEILEKLLAAVWTAEQDQTDQHTTDRLTTIADSLRAAKSDWNRIVDTLVAPVQYGESQFFPVRDNGEIHPMDPVSGFDAGYIDDTFPDGSQPLGVPDPERYIAAGAIDRR